MEENTILMKKNLLWKAGAIIVIVVLGFLVFNQNKSNELTGQVVAASDKDIQSAKLYMKNNEYRVEPSVLKKNIPVRMTAEVNSLPGCAKSVVIRDFGVRKSVSTANNIIEFTPDKTGTIEIACSMNMYHGTFTVVE